MRMVMFTDEEIVAARQMLDVALKAMGRPAVNAFAAIDRKLAAVMMEKAKEAKQAPTEAKSDADVSQSISKKRISK